MMRATGEKSKNSLNWINLGIYVHRSLSTPSPTVRSILRTDWRDVGHCHTCFSANYL
jgi:hypothetical protein